MPTDTPKTRYYVGCQRTDTCEELPRLSCRRKQCDYPDYNNSDVSTFRDRMIFLLIELEKKDTIKETIRAAIGLRRFIKRIPKSQLVFAQGHWITDPETKKSRTQLKKVAPLIAASPVSVQPEKLLAVG